MLIAIVSALSLYSTRARAQATLVDPTLTLETVVTGLVQPSTMAFLGADDFLVLELLQGKVRRVVGGVLQPTPVLTLTPGTLSSPGMLGIAINGASPPQVFVSYAEIVNPSNDYAVRVYRYDWNPGAQTLDNATLLFTTSATAAGTFHTSGVMVLGPPDDPENPPPVGDGQLLYVAIGELERRGQLQNDPVGPAPDDTSVVLRLLQDGTAAPGNPFSAYCSVTTTQTCTPGSCPGAESCLSGVEQYWEYGIRNVFGLALDPVTGDLWDTHNGAANWDEVNHVEPGLNNGWTPLMGPGDPGSVSLFDMPGAGSTYADPAFSWFDPTGVTGIVFPHGSSLGTNWDDTVLVADFISPGQIYALPLDGPRLGMDLAAFPNLQDLVADTRTEHDQLLFGTGFSGGITDLERGPDGAIYVVAHNQGTIYRISGTPSVPVLPWPGLGLLVSVLLGVGFSFFRSKRTHTPIA